MPASTLTGSRIRERRTHLGLRQADLARHIGISPAYLNLIEHNRRRIGGKVLLDLARALEVEPTALTEGAEARLLTGLRSAAAGPDGRTAETDRLEEYAGRFPGWAGLTEAQARRIAVLERTVSTLSDRLTHDPHLAASLHDVLDTVTSIRSTSAILVETPDIEGEWRDRFNRNLFEDSQRLAESSRALVGYLDGAGKLETGLNSPQEELEAWLAARGYHIAELERALPAPAAEVLRSAETMSGAGRALAAGFLARYQSDARIMPLGPFRAALAELGVDPGALATRFGADAAAVLRRLALVPAADGETPAAGLAICDGSGTLTFRKPIDTFPLPRFGAACPLWPLYQALARPSSPVRALISLPGRRPARFLAYAVSQPARAASFEAPPTFEATMLILPEDRVPLPAQPEQPVGTSCRICPRAGCDARREPSIVAEDT